MEARVNGTKYRNYYLWDNAKNLPYDYEKRGLLKRIMSNVIVSTQQPILKNVLKYFENSLVYLMKYVDKLKQFKNYHYYNR
jgi:hypothetical protein